MSKWVPVLEEKTREEELVEAIKEAIEILETAGYFEEKTNSAINSLKKILKK